MRSRCLCKPRSERGAGRYEARNERTTKELRKQIEQARLIQLNRYGLGMGAASFSAGGNPACCMSDAPRVGHCAGAVKARLGITPALFAGLQCLARFGPFDASMAWDVESNSDADRLRGLVQNALRVGALAAFRREMSGKRPWGRKPSP